MSSFDEIHAQNVREGFSPTVDNVPRSAAERFHDACLFGAPITIISYLIVGVFMLQPNAIMSGGSYVRPPTELSNILLIPATIALIPALAGLFAVFGMLFHPFIVRSEINHWARHGYYREGFHPHGFEVRKLREVPNDLVKKLRLKKARSQR